MSDHLDGNTTRHAYPSAYPPGAHWALDEAWALLDTLKPGVLPNEVRLFLAGGIAGILMRHAQQLRRALLPLAAIAEAHGFPPVSPAQQEQNRDQEIQP